MFHFIENTVNNKNIFCKIIGLVAVQNVFFLASILYTLYSLFDSYKSSETNS